MIKIFKKFLSKIDWTLVIVVLAGIIASRSLLFESGYFVMHDDLQMMRQLSMEKCFLDLQIPCRWIPDMGYGFGFPLFNFYPPLPYLVGELFRVIGFTFVNTVKVTFALSIIFSGVGMYYLGKKLQGKLAGVIAAVFYIWAPYHSVDVYVRGAMNEAWALVFFPLIFLFSYKLITEKEKKDIIFLGLSYAGLFLSHNLMVMIFTPVFAGWCLIWIFVKKSNFVSMLTNLSLGGLLGLGLSAFFTIPAVVENKLTWLESQLVGYYDYSAHFATIKQLLFSRFWGYGPSIWLDADGMSFQVGHLHWISSLIVGGYALLQIYKSVKKKKKVESLWIVVGFLFLVGWFAAFMNHQRSTPIYQILPFLGLVQFPWRFLTLVIFSFSLLTAFIPELLKRLNVKRIALVTTLLSLGLILFNWNYFLPMNGKMGALSDEEKFKDAAWDLQQTAGIYDYLPLTAKEAPKAPQKVLAEFLDEKGEKINSGEITNMSQKTNSATFNVKVDTESARVRVNIFEFPNWKIFIDGKETEVKVPEIEKWGRMWVTIPKGEHSVEVEFHDTPVRAFSNVISVASWLGLVGIVVYNLKRGRARN